MDTVPDVVSYSAQVGHAAIPEEYAGKAVSAVLVKVKDGYSAQQVASNIAKATGIKSLGYVYPGGITATTKNESQGDYPLCGGVHHGVLDYGFGRDVGGVFVGYERTQA